MLRALMVCALLGAVVGCSEGSDGGSGNGGTSGKGGAAAGGSSNTGGNAGTAGSSGSSGSGGAVAGSGGASAGTSGSGGATSGGTASDGGASGAAGAAGDAYNPCPAKGTACSVMPLGDSITDGVGSSGGGYRPELFHLSLADSKTITFVGSGENGPELVDGIAFPKQHEGHSGFTIQQIRDSIVIWVQGANPHIVTLMIGTNDMNTNLDVVNAPMRLGDLIDDILDTNSTALLVVAQIVPSTDDGLNTKIQAYNAAIPDLVATRADAGKHITTVDMYTAFTANANYKAEYMADTLHPNDAGYKVMASTWYAEIGPLFR